MKKIFKKIIIWIITIEAKIVLFRFKPKVIAITGSVGKTSTKDAIFTALSDSLHIRKNQKSFNSDIGVPLTILGLDNGYNNILKWLENIFSGIWVVFKKEYPKWLVLEFGVDRPGDMEYLVKWIKVDIAVFTSFPDVPVHVEYFSSPEEVIYEKKKLLNAVKPDGFIVLNADDSKVLEIKNISKRKVMTYGIEKPADIKVSNEEILYKDGKPFGVNFKVDYEGNSIPFKIEGVLGRQHIYPSLAATVCGLILNVTPIEISDALSKIKTAPGRMKLLEGEGGSIIIDDTYNSSPIALQEAIRVLGKLETEGSKIAVLGDMSEIGKYTANEHKIIGKMVYDMKIDYLFTLGKRAEFIAEEAVKSGMDKEKAYSFSEFGELLKKLRDQKIANSVILVKGSQVMRMERVVEQMIEDKENKEKLLVRQDPFWSL